MADSFHDAMVAGYALSEPSLVIGSPMDGITALPDVRVQVALSMLNRHGLVAGATGTGKTKTLQLLAGQLSLGGVPVLIADIKGDLTGLALPGDATNAKVLARAAELARGALDAAATPAGRTTSLPARVPVTVGIG